MGNQMIQIVYSNSNCADVFNVFLACNKKYTTLPLYVISDFDASGIKGVIGNHIYDNSEPYWKVWVDALEKFKQENFIYLQEDFFLYDKVKEPTLEIYRQLLNMNTKYSFIRLLKSGQLNQRPLCRNLYEIEPTNEQIFSMQATIWKTADYVKLMKAVQDPKWLENDKYRAAMIQMNMAGLYHYDNEPQVGANHCDSNVYPYIATAVVKGKWNLSEYYNLLFPILKDYNINIAKRGTC